MSLADYIDIIDENLKVKKPKKISLLDFFKEAWSVVEPGTELMMNWHIEAIAEHLQAVADREIRNLVISVPPRHGKSNLASVCLSAWVWTFNPSERFLYSSYSQELSTKHSLACRRIITSDWYQQHWGAAFCLTGDQNRKMFFENDRRGYRFATSVGGAGTGFGGSFILVDDPHNVREAPSAVKRQEVITWWREVMSTRLDDPMSGVKIIIMQRVHQNDLSGYILSEDDGQWDHLYLPTEYVPSRSITTSIGWKDPRTEDRELLWPERYDKRVITSIKKDLGAAAYACQHQQNPTPPQGGMIKKSWWKYYEGFPKDDQGRALIFDEVIQSWDCAFKDTQASSFVVGQVWGRKGANKYLLDQVRDRMDFVATLKAIKAMTMKWPQASIKLIEDKANGPAVINSLSAEIYGIIPVDPQGGKVARLFAVSPQIESGNVYLPLNAEWVEDYVEELGSATEEGGGQFWDQIDATSQALLRLSKGKRRITWGRRTSEESGSELNDMPGVPKRKFTFGRRMVSIGGRRRSSIS